MSDVKINDDVINSVNHFIRNFADIRVDDIKYKDSYELRWKTYGLASTQVTMLLEILVASGIIEVDEESKSIKINKIQ